MKQISLFAEETRLQKLSELGDCLERLKIIDWESFRPIIALALIRERKQRRHRAKPMPLKVHKPKGSLREGAVAGGLPRATEGKCVTIKLAHT